MINVPTAGRPWSASAARLTLHRSAVEAGIRRRFAPHQLRHAHAVEMAREGISLTIIQRQLGHANLSITSIYLQGIDQSEIIDTVYRRPAPSCPQGPLSADLPLGPGSGPRPPFRALPQSGSRRLGVCDRGEHPSDESLTPQVQHERVGEANSRR